MNERRNRPTEAITGSWQVFVRTRRGLSHTHVGTVRAGDAARAHELAWRAFGPGPASPERDDREGRDGASIWVVRSSAIHSSLPEQQGRYFEPAADKTFRHPTFFVLPEEVRNL